MISLHDFCSTCADGTSIKLSFYDINTRELIVDVVFNNAKEGAKILGVEYSYARVESFYASGDVVCCECYVFNA